MSATDVQPRATWREWLGLAVMMVPVFMMATDITVLFLAMPEVTADLAPSGTQMLWMLHIADFMAVGFVLTMGRLGERIGQRRLLAAGVAVYGVASAAAAMSTAPEQLIVFRAVLGVAAATMMPAIIGLLRRMFPDPKQFSLALAVNLSAFSAGSALGPPLGGLLLEFFWWGAVFLANVPAAVLLLATVWLLPGRRMGDASRIDLPSVALSLAAILAVIYGLQELAASQDDAASGQLLPYAASVLVGLGLGALFVRRQLRLSDPLIDMQLFRIPSFTVPIVAVLLVLLAAVGTDMLFAQHLQAVLGLSPAQAGLWLMVPAVTSVAGTMAAPRLARWLGPAYAIAVGLVVAAAGAAAMAALAGTAAGVVLLIVVVAMLSLGVGPTMTLGANLMVSSAPPQRASSAAAVNDVSAGFGQGIGIALIGSVAMAVYRWQLELPPEVSGAEAQAARDSVGGALATAAGQPGEAGGRLAASAQAAFTSGTQVAYAMGAVLLLGLAALVVWRLRHARLGSPE